MIGHPLWDAAIWLVLGALGGAALTHWRSLRSALVFGVAVSLIGMVAALGVALARDGAGLGLALAILFWSLPCSLGLALGGLALLPFRGAGPRRRERP